VLPDDYSKPLEQRSSAGRQRRLSEKWDVVKEDYKTPHPWQKKRSDERKLGLIMVNTGPGKGKTTAALGLALRALGHNHKVKIVQFMKGDPFFGELLLRERLPELDIAQYGLDRFVDPRNPQPGDISKALEGFAAAKQAIRGGAYNVVILDEVNVAMSFGLVPIAEMVEVLRQKPKHVEVILTGRDAPPAILEIADYVNEVIDVKHPYKNKIPARVGIEF
jgi:cob(I)alamin adenosyltransferase